MRSPSRSTSRAWRTRCRAPANRRPAAAATSRRNARLKPSDSSEPCQWVPQVRRPGSRPRRAHRLSLRRPRGGSRPRPPRGPRRRAGSGSSPGRTAPDGQHPQPRPVRAGSDVVLDVLAEELEAAADAEDRPPSSYRTRACGTALPQPLQGTDGTWVPGPPPGPRRPAPRPVHEPHDDARFGGEGVDVGEVGHQRARHTRRRSTSSPTERDLGLLYGAPQEIRSRPPRRCRGRAGRAGRHVRRPRRSCSMSRPGSRSETSPRNGVDQEPGDQLLVLPDSSATVPKKEAKTPPRSMALTTSTGSPALRATPMLTMSVRRRLISAGDGPHRSPHSTCPRNSARHSSTVPSNCCCRPPWYPRALSSPTGLPSSTTDCSCHRRPE